MDCPTSKPKIVLEYIKLCQEISASTPISANYIVICNVGRRVDLLGTVVASMARCWPRRPAFIVQVTAGAQSKCCACVCLAWLFVMRLRSRRNEVVRGHSQHRRSCQPRLRKETFVTTDKQTDSQTDSNPDSDSYSDPDSDRQTDGQQTD